MKEFSNQKGFSKKAEDKLGLFLKSNSHHFKTEASFLSYIRQGIRQGIWNKHPVKMEFIKNQRTLIKNPNPNGRKEKVYGGVCACCNGEFVMKDLQVDHKSGEISLKSMDDIQDFITKIAVVNYEDLQYLCITCHEIKTYSERYDVSLNRALAVKKAIITMKLGEDEKELVRFGVAYIPKAKTKRRALLEDLYESEVEKCKV